MLSALDATEGDVLEYVIRRILWGLLTILLVLALVFVIFFVVPGGAGHTEKGQRYPSVAYLIAGRRPTQATVQAVVRRLDLDKPVYVQFGVYVSRVFTGDLGYSYNSRESVGRTLMQKLPATAGLVVGASIIWLAIGGSVG